MTSEKQKMLSGELYDPMDPVLVAGRRRARDLCQSLNASADAAHDERRRILRGKPIEIGADVWVGGGAIILPGVKIGNAAVVGAGSVVTKDIPPGVFAAGNPCRLIREITG
jgi:acetyltransferase-like isoleucine patch superfamily enzyme